MSFVGRSGAGPDPQVAKRRPKHVSLSACLPPSLPPSPRSISPPFGTAAGKNGNPASAIFEPHPEHAPHRTHTSTRLQRAKKKSCRIPFSRWSRDRCPCLWREEEINCPCILCENPRRAAALESFRACSRPSLSPFTGGEASRSIGNAFILEKFLIRGLRAKKSMKSIIVEMAYLTSDIFSP